MALLRIIKATPQNALPDTVWWERSMPMRIAVYTRIRGIKADATPNNPNMVVCSTCQALVPGITISSRDRTPSANSIMDQNWLAVSWGGLGGSCCRSAGFSAGRSAGFLVPRALGLGFFFGVGFFCAATPVISFFSVCILYIL